MEEGIPRSTHFPPSLHAHLDSNRRGRERLDSNLFTRCAFGIGQVPGFTFGQLQVFNLIHSLPLLEDLSPTGRAFQINENYVQELVVACSGTPEHLGVTCRPQGAVYFFR